MKQVRGLAHVYGDSIDTDRIIPGKYTKTLDRQVLAAHVLEDLDPAFAAAVRAGDILVAGRHFGSGSSREQAPIAIQAAGIAAVVALSFARIFYRNAVNIGLPVVEVDRHTIRQGDEILVDLLAGNVSNLTRQENYPATRMPPQMIAILEAGGLVAYLQKYKDYGKGIDDPLSTQ